MGALDVMELIKQNRCILMYVPAVSYISPAIKKAIPSYSLKESDTITDVVNNPGYMIPTTITPMTTINITIKRKMWIFSLMNGLSFLLLPARVVCTTIGVHARTKMNMNRYNQIDSMNPTNDSTGKTPLQTANGRIITILPNNDWR